jgi:hypothetical protein
VLLAAARFILVKRGEPDEQPVGGQTEFQERSSTEES